jgi:hypothetical protein
MSGVCLNGGTCSEFLDNTVCQCTAQYAGSRCEYGKYCGHVLIYSFEFVRATSAEHFDDR